jgi:hypothetical protein
MRGDCKMALSIADVKRSVNDALNGGVVDETLKLICFAYSDLCDVDQLFVGKVVIDIAERCDNVSALLALELIYKTIRFVGMTDGSFPKTQFFIDNARLPFSRGVPISIFAKDEEMIITNDF